MSNGTLGFCIGISICQVCIPFDSTLCACPTVHPIPLYHMGQNGQTGIVPSVPFAMPCSYLLSIPTYCPFHPTVTWEEMDGLGSYPMCPIWYAWSLLSTSSHCTIGGNGQTGIVPKCAICNYAEVSLST